MNDSDSDSDFTMETLVSHVASHPDVVEAAGHAQLSTRQAGRVPPGQAAAPGLSLAAGWLSPLASIILSRAMPMIMAEVKLAVHKGLFEANRQMGIDFSSAEDGINRSLNGLLSRLAG